jgi:two-component system, sensor histidine kinase LadS
MKFFIFWLIGLWSISFTLEAQNSVIIRELTHLEEIGKKTAYWIDTKGQASFAQVYTQHLKDFKPFQENNYDWGFDEKIAVWVKFNIQNLSKAQLLFELSNSNLDSIAVFVRTSEGLISQFWAGDDYPFPSRFAHINRFLFPLPAADCEVFLRVKSHTSLFFTPRVGTVKSITERLHRLYLWHGFYFGIIILIAFYNLILFSRLREWLYLIYVGNIGALALVVAFENGYGLEFLWYQLPIINDYPMLVYFTSIASVYFIESFLEVRKYNSRYYWVFRLIYLSYFSLLIIDLASYRALSSQLFRLITLFTVFYTWFLAIYIFRRHPSDWFLRLFFIGWSGNLLGIVLYILGLMSLIPYEGWGRESILIGNIWEVCFLSWAIVEKMRSIKLKQETTQAALVDSLQTNEKILKEQNQMLETKVQERTQEIADQNAQLVAQEEELIQQHKVLEMQAQTLIEQNQLIESQNLALQDHQIHLEKIVEERTQELVKNNELLLWQNDKLEKFGFITAHNFRAPVARILGLINLLDLENSQFSTDPLLTQIQKTAYDLDEVIKDMNLILETQRHLEESYSVVNLEEVYQLAYQKLSKEIETQQIKIETSFSQIKRVFAISHYIESIFYHLISNAIKFKSPKRPIEITIQSLKKDKEAGFCIQDNGLGMDMKVFGDKIFSLYQKYHLHREGKGIGLYLVKTQVEAMQGRIEVESQTEGGSMFTIWLPN